MALLLLIPLFLLFLIIRLFFIMLGWDLFMVPVFGMSELTWLQALGLAILLPSPVNYNNKK